MKDEIAGPAMTFQKSDTTLLYSQEDRRAQMEQQIQVLRVKKPKRFYYFVETTFSRKFPQCFRFINQLLPRNRLVVDKLCF